MKIKKIRIRNLELNLPGIVPGDILVFAVKELTEHHNRLETAGFTQPFTTATAVLPTARGPVSRFNAEGKFIVHRDQTKETVYRQREWTHKEWHGDAQVEKTDFVNIPYQRYPRSFVPPPGVEFRLATTTSDELLLVTEEFVYTAETSPACLHTVNLLLEYFGECHVLNQDLDSIVRVAIKRFHWQILPEGVRPWQHLQSLLKERIPQFDSDKYSVFRSNLAFINDFKPNFVAVGRAGFSGYVVFGFPQKDIYVCESIYKNNATYVFSANWQSLSQMTKAEILDQHLQKDRVVHMPGWHDRIRRILH